VCEQEGSGPCLFCSNLVRLVSGWESVQVLEVELLLGAISTYAGRTKPFHSKSRIKPNVKYFSAIGNTFGVTHVWFYYCISLIV
jgi:hypothetical protein